MLHRPQYRLRQADSADSKLSLSQGTVFLLSTMEEVTEEMMVAPKLHMITGGESFDASVQAAIQAAPWVDYIHLRNKAASACQLEAWAHRMLQASISPSKLIINDRVDVALAVGACGVQLAWHSLRPGTVKLRWPHLLVGVSVHSPHEAVDAFTEGADYVLFGHVYESASKPGESPRGLHLLEETTRLAGGKPVIALGGIQPAHIPELLRSGATGIAVLSGIGAAVNPAHAAQEYRSAVLKEVILHDAHD
ncbi:MAG: transcriptional regulator TenI [Paenibacillaceae bacterium]|nr:transcriptional regulator TenI [Paenibacillaceae bacterium]